MGKIRIAYDGRLYTPTAFPLRIGRAPDNDIVVCAPGVGEYHAFVEESGEGLLLRAAEESHLDGGKIDGTALLPKNGLLTLGGATLHFWGEAKQAILKPYRSPGWRFVTHPLATLFWISLALFIPLWQDYLNTEKYYIFNWRLLFTVGVILLALAWLLDSIVLPIARRHLLSPLLGVVALLFIVSELCNQAAYWYDFQFDNSSVDWLMLFVSWGICFYLLRLFLRDFVPLYGKMRNHYTLLLVLPVLLLLFYHFSQPRDFFAHRAGSYPKYFSGLLREVVPWRETMSLESFFDLKNKSEKNNQLH